MVRDIRMKVETQKVFKSRKPYTKKPISVFSKLPFEIKDMILQQVPRYYEMKHFGNNYMYDIITKKAFQFKYMSAYKYTSKGLDKKSEMIINPDFKVRETPKKFELSHRNSLIKTFMIKNLSVYTKNGLRPRLPWNATELCKKQHKEECLAWNDLVKHLKISKKTVW
jgi:hypothetical protein